MKIRTLSLFTGGGGLDLGFSAAGFSIDLAIELDPYSCKTLEINENKKDFYNKTKVLNKDIKKVTTKEIKKEIGLENNSDKIDLIIGGPPCQAFSVFGKRCGLDDPRGNLIWDYLRIVKELKPAVFIFENVAGLKTIHNGELYIKLIEELSCDGLYTVSDHNYEVANYGIPQFRNRIFFIGVKDGRRIPPMIQTHGEDGSLFELSPYVTVGKVLRNLPEPGNQSNLHNHKGRLHSNRIIDRYKNLKYGERDSKTRINKLNPNRPSYTIIVGSDKGGGKGHVHPYTPREVTPRESARLQTFPDWWEFYGNGRHVIRQVGNAVPPLFAGLLAAHVKKHVFHEKQIPSYDDLINTLGLDFLK
ncbi:MAG TPA: DNA cytosine methyltransferase [Methanofastidiosum sp.]|nr:DNA cytosine methyltransferase [Methanofastidiosum sp.]